MKDDFETFVKNTAPGAEVFHQNADGTYSRGFFVKADLAARTATLHTGTAEKVITFPPPALPDELPAPGETEEQAAARVARFNAGVRSAETTVIAPKE